MAIRTLKECMEQNKCGWGFHATDCPHPLETTVTVRVRVNDPQALVKFATQQYRETWRDDIWRPVSIQQALEEALLFSNANPSPDEYGIEFLR